MLLLLKMHLALSHWSKSMAFAQGLILLRVERLPLQVDLAEGTDEARIVPAVAQGLQKPIPGINLEVTAMAFGAKHLLIVSLTVGFTLLHVKGLIPDRILAGCTLETLNMVSHLQCMHDFPYDLLFALGTVRSVSVIVALGTIDGSPFFKEAPLLQDRLTLRACKLFRVPRPSQCHQVPSPDDFVAGTTYGGPPAVFRRLLRSLQDGTAALHRRGLGWLLVLGHDGADLVWAKAVGKIGVRDPRRSAGRSRTLWCGGGT